MDDSDIGIQTTSMSSSEEPSMNTDQESDIQRLNLPTDEKEQDEGEKKDSEKPLIEEESVKIEINSEHEGEDTPTLTFPDKKSKSKVDLEQKQKFLFPFTRIKEAWNDSSNVLQFLGRATCIIFQTVGWFTCAGGVPFLSLVMLIIGSIYIDECNIQPNIPIYLVVSGVVGTIQHFLTIWAKYVPKDSEGRLKVYRSYCKVLNGLFHFFLIIWFILGCIWVYGSLSEVEFKDPEKDEYCHQTLYYFSFWILNLSFILLGLLVFFSMCFLIFVIAANK